MRTPTQNIKPRTSTVDSFPAPTGGLVSNRNLAMSRGPQDPPAAAILDDWFPLSASVITRRGYRLWSPLPGATPVKSMFTYLSGSTKQMFAANTTSVFNTTVESAPVSVVGGKTSGNWHVVQFSTAGGAFLIGVNGSDPAIQYDGTAWTVPTITFPAPYASMTTADLAYVWAYKQRIWFIQKNSLNAWYLPVDSIGGVLTLWPMGGVFVFGGSLMWGHAWSLDTGGSGGLSEQCVFTTTEGEVAAYQGLSPDVDQGWTKAGLYRIGKPLGRRAFMRAGGDLVIGTSVGFVALSKAANSDFAALGAGAVSYPIEDDWADAVDNRGKDDWRVQLWADGQMVLVAPPIIDGENPIALVSNSNTGKWCRFRGWNITAMTVFDGKLFFGSTDGSVRWGWVGGSDEGVTYNPRVLPLFSDFGTPASRKTLKEAKATTRSPYGSKVQVTGHTNFNAKFPPAPPIDTNVGDDLWNVGLWDVAMWGSSNYSVTDGDWRSIAGAGHDLSVGVQLSSGQPAPIDVELIRIDVKYVGSEPGT